MGYREYSINSVIDFNQLKEINQTTIMEVFSANNKKSLDFKIPARSTVN